MVSVQNCSFSVANDVIFRDLNLRMEKDQNPYQLFLEKKE